LSMTISSSRLWIRMDCILSGGPARPRLIYSVEILRRLVNASTHSLKSAMLCLSEK
jgi:hypothetical protein